MIIINYDSCTSCAACIDLCPVIAMSLVDDAVKINHEVCTECGTCIKVCPLKAPYEGNS
jgi:ferredoxin